MGGVSMVSAAVYLLPASDPFVRRVTSVFPYPIAVVEHRWITFRSFFQMQDAFTRVRFFPSEQEETPDETFIQEDTLDAMMDRALVELLAERYGLRLDANGVGKFMAVMTANGMSDAAFAREIEERFGFEVDEFIRYVIHPAVLAGQVRDAVFADAQEQGEARQRLERYASRVRGGEAFADLFASTEGEFDIQGGDWGYVTIAEMPDAWRAMVPELAMNAYSDVLELPDAFSFVQVVERIEAPEGARYKLNVMMVMKRDLEAVKNELRQHVRVWRFLKT
jgi:hypothetical protein